MIISFSNWQMRCITFVSDWIFIRAALLQRERNANTKELPPLYHVSSPLSPLYSYNNRRLASGAFRPPWHRMTVNRYWCPFVSLLAFVFFFCSKMHDPHSAHLGMNASNCDTKFLMFYMCFFLFFLLFVESISLASESLWAWADMSRQQQCDTHYLSL